ncbi:MAG: LptF/LptG family permease [Phycisphaerae bacterium]|nr:LptF/LptG family permease [Phycisphaerae bacterium]
MPLTLYRYVLFELLKLLGASVVVLVVVMSFAFSIKPISEGLLEPWQMVKVLAFTMPGMLGFALPFAGAFASTLVFFRMSSDNEISACAVSGVSYASLLMPVVALGLVLTLGMFYLSNWVVPTFWSLVSSEIEQDIAGLVVKQIQRGEPVKFGRELIYADRAENRVPAATPEDPGRLVPDNRIVLTGVAVGRLQEPRVSDRGGRQAIYQALRADATADQAVIDLYHDQEQDRIYATMMLLGVTVNDPDSGMLAAIERWPIKPLEVPQPLQQEPKFMSLPDLRQMARDPKRSPRVRQAKQDLSEALAEHVLLGKLAAILGYGELPLRSPQEQTYLIRSPQATYRDGAVHLQAEKDTKVLLRIRYAGRIIQRLEAEAGRLEVSGNDLGEEPSLNLVLERFTVMNLTTQDEATGPTRQLITLPLLNFREPILADLARQEIPELLQLATKNQGHAPVKPLVAGLQKRMANLIRDITSRLHERAAMAMNCLLVLLLGAVMSMLLRHQIPLAIFFWCFAPTVVAFLTITSGQTLIGRSDLGAWIGMTMTWSGNVALLLMIGFIYTRLCRN